MRVQESVKLLGITIRLACEIFGISQTCNRYTTKLSDVNIQIAEELLQFTDEHKRWEFKLCFDYVRNIKGRLWNHKRVYRIYCELELNFRKKT